MSENAKAVAGLLAVAVVAWLAWAQATGKWDIALAWLL